MIKSRNFLALMLVLQASVYVTAFFDIPVARQVIGFAYFTFVPGLLIVKLLRFDGLDIFETVLFSLGLSVAFLMLVGLLVNETGAFFGFSRPLAFMPLMLVLNTLILIIGILVSSRSGRSMFWSPRHLRRPLISLFFLCLPVLSILGAIWLNIYSSNLILFFLIIAISVLLVVGVISVRILSPTLYPFALLMIAIALLYHASLISNYLVSFGSDVQLEYFLFKTTINNAHWSSAPSPLWSESYGRTNAMLSITILPTVYSTLLSLDPTWIFKSVFPLIFALVPLGLYRVWSAYVDRKYALLSTFLFIAQSTYYGEMLGLNRQMIGELFLVLLLLVIFDKKMKPLNKITLFVIFSFALITSHYALAEIFLLLISFAVISLIAHERILKRTGGKIAVSMVVLFFVLMFTWYIYTSGSAVFDSLLSFGNNVYSQLGEFSNPASRGETVLAGLGMAEAPTVWNSISRAFAYITEGLMVVGFFGLILRRTKIHLDMDYFVLSSAAMVLLIALLLVPGLANTLNMTRFYHILLFFLAPFVPIGAEVIVGSVSKRRREVLVSLLLLIVLVPYFLFQTGFVYEVTGTQSYSLPLSKHRMSAIFLHWYIGYFDDSEVFGAIWISGNIDVENSKTYGDVPSTYVVLIGYGMINSGNLNVLSNLTMLSAGDNVYLNRVNVVDGVVLGSRSSWKTTSISDIWLSSDKVYSNGECEIYKRTIGS